MGDLIINRYKDQKYSVLFNKRTGFFARIEDEFCAEPFWAEHGPELLDIAITNYCQKGCNFCYRQSNVQGQHMPFSDYQNLIEQARNLGVLQIALGGGNPNQHPEFIRFIKTTREYGIIPSFTTNGDGLTKEILQATREYCGAIAVSAYKPYNKMDDIIGAISHYGIKINVHFIVSLETIKIAIDWLQSPPMFFNKINAIIFLNFKPINTSPEFILSRSDKLKQFFNLIRHNRYKFKIGFDSCFISGIVSNLNVKSIYIDSCDSARFSAFISEDMKMYPCSFMINSKAFGDLRKNSILEIWKSNDLFQSQRSKIKDNKCSSCCFEKDCRGGCVFLPKINLCAMKNNTKA